MANDQLRLTLAAIAARDDLRSVIMPGLEKLSGLIGDNPEAEKLIKSLHATAWKDCDALRVAIKDRMPASARQARGNQNLPCWHVNKV